MLKKSFIIGSAFASILINDISAKASWTQKDQDILNALTGRGGASISYTGGGMFEITTPSHPSTSYSSAYRSPSYLSSNYRSLEDRQKIVNLQLQEHERLNNVNSEKKSTFYEAIRQAEKDSMDIDFYEQLYCDQKGLPYLGPTPGVRITTPEADALYDLNKQANNAKHKW